MRAKKDKKAVEHIVENYYGNGYEVVSLRGVRGYEETVKGIMDNAADDKYNIVLLDRGHAQCAEELEAELPRNTVLRVIPRRDIRNTRPEHLYREIEAAKNRQRLQLYLYGGKYDLGRRGRRVAEELWDSDDLFILRHRIPIVKGMPVGDYLVYKRELDHIVLGGDKPAGTFSIPYEKTSLEYRGEQPQGLDTKAFIEENTDVVRRYEITVVKKFLEQFEDYERILVPWSGGKDSTMVLYLAMDVFGKDRITAVTADMDYDFRETRRYIEEAEERLGVEVVHVPVNLKPHIPGNGLPSHSNRWCTALKVEALENAYRRICGDKKCLILVGDRDVESEARSRRPIIRKTATGYTQVAPLKQWSTIVLQVALAAYNVPLNPLYELGFYRIGCSICPFLRAWEIAIMLRSPSLHYLFEDDVFHEFLRSKGYKGYTRFT